MEDLNIIKGKTLKSAEKLYDYIVKNHIDEDGFLIGPDSGIRWNLRIWRFVKSYLYFIKWNDNLYSNQAQGYWMLDNIDFYEITNDTKYLETAIECADKIISKQMKDGCWEYGGSSIWKNHIFIF